MTSSSRRRQAHPASARPYAHWRPAGYAPRSATTCPPVPASRCSTSFEAKAPPSHVRYRVGSAARTPIVQTSAHSLFGREQDVARLGAFVKEAAEDGGAVLVTGDAGVGKTALVDVIAAQARQR